MTRRSRSRTSIGTSRWGSACGRPSSTAPSMVQYLLPSELDEGHGPATSALARFHQAFNRGFERFREGYLDALGWTLQHRPAVFAIFGLGVLSAAVLLPFVGRDFFPKVDAGQIRLHVT